MSIYRDKLGYRFLREHEMIDMGRPFACHADFESARKLGSCPKAPRPTRNDIWVEGAAQSIRPCGDFSLPSRWPEKPQDTREGLQGSP